MPKRGDCSRLKVNGPVRGAAIRALVRDNRQKWLSGVYFLSAMRPDSPKPFAFGPERD